MAKNIVEKLLSLLSLYGNQYLNYRIEIANGDVVDISKERGLVFYGTLQKHFKDGYAYDFKVVNSEPEETLMKILQKVKRAIIADIRAF